MNVPAIDGGNVVSVLQNAFIKHLANRDDIEYLYKYYKGIQPILSRMKEVRPEICNTIVENRANQIVTFRVGYTVGKPVQYISSVGEDGVSKTVARLNDMMRIAGKATKDKLLVEWQMICGTGYRMVLPKEQPDKKVPFDLYTTDPRQTFVIYRNDVGKKPLAGVYYVQDDDQNCIFDVYTAEGQYFKISGWQPGKIISSSRFNLGMIPIIEYPLNMSRLGAFEVVLPLLDSINNLESNRLDSVEQFVQSLLIAINCRFDDDVTANKIREAGMVALQSVGENKAELKVISESLDQQQTQTLKQALLDAIYEIAGIPSQANGKTSDSSNNGAVILRNGWQGAETRAQDYEQMFREPEQRLLELVSVICGQLSDLKFEASDVEPKFTRRNYEDLLSKSQTLVSMLGQEKIHPQCAYEACGLFLDTQEAYNMGMEWYRTNKEEEERKQQEMQEQMSGGEPEQEPEPEQEQGSGSGSGGSDKPTKATEHRHWVRGYWKD